MDKRGSALTKEWPIIVGNQGPDKDNKRLIAVAVSIINMAKVVELEVVAFEAKVCWNH